MGKQKLKSLVNVSLSENREDNKQEISLISQKDKLSFETIIKAFHHIIETFPDCRVGKNIHLSLKDGVLCAFSVFFTQSPSFLSHQHRIQIEEGHSNATSLLGIQKIMSDSHIRRLLDPIPITSAYPIFWQIFNSLLSEGYISHFRSFNGNFLVALDATGYFSSETIHCENCSQKNQKNGSITYSHNAITPVLVSPGIRKAISLVPEFIVPQDGHVKQDCENAAAKRWLKAHSGIFKRERTTILGDDLYCHQPFCELVLAKGLDFILNCKESSHITIYEYIGWLKEEVTVVRRGSFEGTKKFKDIYRFFNWVPLRDGKDALEVNL